MTKIGEGFVYKGRPVVSHMLKDKVRQMRRRSEEQKRQGALPPVPEEMKGKVVRYSRGYAANLHCDGKPYRGPMRATPEEALADRKPYGEFAKNMAPLKRAYEANEQGHSVAGEGTPGTRSRYTDKRR